MEIKLEDDTKLKPVTITFTPEEFEMLQAVCGNISGEPLGPLRVMADKIYDFGWKNGYTKPLSQSSVPFVSSWKMYAL